MVVRVEVRVLGETDSEGPYWVEHATVLALQTGPVWYPMTSGWWSPEQPVGAFLLTCLLTVLVSALFCWRDVRQGVKPIQSHLDGVFGYQEQAPFRPMEIRLDARAVRIDGELVEGLLVDSPRLLRAADGRSWLMKRALSVSDHDNLDRLLSRVHRSRGDARAVPEDLSRLRE